MTTTERILAGKASYPLCSFLPFQTAKFAVWVFVQICNNLSVSLTADSSPERGAFGLAYHQNQQ
ncbi:MAG: hypothetical protein SOV32_03435, partial [Oscillospiraceae bacterium]|nr:hypothetical protein [Clostridiales bacterium]MDY2717694.1 hypothetical protein [Oscillospiraceae bacterium]